MCSRRSTWVDVEHNTIGGSMRLGRILLSAGLWGCAPAALAQSSAEYPHRAIRIYVPLSADDNLANVATQLSGPCSARLGTTGTLVTSPRLSHFLGHPDFSRSDKVI